MAEPRRCLLPAAALVTDASRVAAFEALQEVVKAPVSEQADVAKAEWRSATARVLLLATARGLSSFLSASKVARTRL